MRKTKKVGKSKVGKVSKQPPFESTEKGAKVVTAKQPPEVQKKEKQKEKPTRIEACVKVLQGGGEFDREGLIKAADDYYVKHGGTSNLKESEWSYRHSFTTLKAAGMIEEVGDKFHLKR